jgi:hypothetical protein
MKTIKMPAGIRRIEDSDANVTLFKLRDILHDQRNTFINRMTGDLTTYIDYRFQARPTSRQLEVIKDRLQSLKNSALDLERYDFIIQHFLSNPVTYVSAAPFYHEIDSYIREELNDAQLRLVK